MGPITRSHLLDRLLGRRTAAVLSVILGGSEMRMYQRQIARRSGLRLLQAQRALHALAEIGILRAEREGNRVYYSLDPSCPILGELKTIVLKTAGLVDVLRGALSDLPRIEAAFVYGSMARGEPSADSDIDLIVLGGVTLQELLQRLGRVQDILAREVNPTVYPVPEFQQKIADGHHFLTAVIEGAKLFVIGDADALERLARRGGADQASGDA